MEMVLAPCIIQHLDNSFRKCIQLRARSTMHTLVRALTCSVGTDHLVVFLEMVDGETVAVSQMTSVPHPHGLLHSPPLQLRPHSSQSGLTLFIAVEVHLCHHLQVLHQGAFLTTGQMVHCHSVPCPVKSQVRQ